MGCSASSPCRPSPPAGTLCPQARLRPTAKTANEPSKRNLPSPAPGPARSPPAFSGHDEHRREEGRDEGEKFAFQLPHDGAKLPARISLPGPKPSLSLVPRQREEKKRSSLPSRWWLRGSGTGHWLLPTGLRVVLRNACNAGEWSPARLEDHHCSASEWQ